MALVSGVLLIGGLGLGYGMTPCDPHVRPRDPHARQVPPAPAQPPLAVDVGLLQQMQDMGFPRWQSARALMATGNRDVQQVSLGL